MAKNAGQASSSETVIIGERGKSIGVVHVIAVTGVNVVHIDSIMLQENRRHLGV